MRPEMKFVGRLRALFGPPDAEANAVIDEYTRALSGQSASTLDRAADHLAKTHKFRSWPTVAECLDAVARARKGVNSAAMGLEPIDDFDGWWAERMARVSTAKTENEITREMKQIEPYHTARWIASHRLTEAIAAANQRRLEWQGQRSADSTRRIVGDRE